MRSILFICCMPLMLACGQKQNELEGPVSQAQVIPVGKGPDALFLTPDEDFLYVANVEDTHISVVDTGRDSVVQNIETVGYPWGFTRLGNSNLVAVSGWDKGIDIIDFIDHKIIKSQRYSQNLGGIGSTLDGKTILVVATEENKVLRIDTEDLAIIDEYETGKGPDGIGIGKGDRRIYVTNTKEGTISIIDLQDKTSKKIDVGGKPELIHSNHDRSALYISNFLKNKIHILSTETDKIIYEIPGLDGPEEAVLSPSGEKLYVVNFNTSQVLTFDGKSNQQLDETFEVGLKPIGIITTIDGSKTYVTNYGDNTVSVIKQSSDH